MLPNSANVILAAERAAELSEKPARVVPTTAPQEGLAGAAGVRSRRRAPRRTTRRSPRPPRRCASAASPRPPATTPRAASTPATRVGYAGGELVAWGDPAATLRGHARARSRDGSELITCIAGDGRRRSTRDDARARASRTGSSSSTTRAASRRGGGCSARSNRVRRRRPTQLTACGAGGADARRVALAGRAPRRVLADAGSRASRRQKATAKALATLGIATYGDLIEHLPHSHRDQRDLRRVGDLAIGEDATVAVDGAQRRACGRCATAARSSSRRRSTTRPARWWRSGSTSPGSPTGCTPGSRGAAARAAAQAARRSRSRAGRP